MVHFGARGALEERGAVFEARGALSLGESVLLLGVAALWALRCASKRGVAGARCVLPRNRALR